MQEQGYMLVEVEPGRSEQCSAACRLLFSFCKKRFQLRSFHRLEGRETEAQRGMELPGGATVTERMSQGLSLPLAPLSPLCSLGTPVSPNICSYPSSPDPSTCPIQAPLLPFRFLQGPSVHPWVAPPSGRGQGPCELWPVPAHSLSPLSSLWWS